MIGLSTVVDSYTAFDPSSSTRDGLIELAGFIRRFRKEFTADVICQPFEDATISGVFDFALTSPPYFDTEIYSDEPTNSCNRYASYEDWVAGFYLPMLDKTMRHLSPSGAAVFNIGSRRYPLARTMEDRCRGRYRLRRLPGMLSGKAGMGKDGEGEAFYEVRHMETP